MAGGRWLAAVAMVAVALGLGYTAYRVYRGPRTEQCYACRRPVHANMRTLATVDGQSRTFCCPACALTEHEQEGKPIQITELTDFLTGAKLSPSQAFLVKGSDINECAQTHEVIGADRRAADVLYDRCSPSLLAFGQRSDAVQFTREHGGQVLAFSEIRSQFAH